MGRANYKYACVVDDIECDIVIDSLDMMRFLRDNMGLSPRERLFTYYCNGTKRIPLTKELVGILKNKYNANLTGLPKGYKL